MVGLGLGIGLGLGGNQGGAPSNGPLCDAIARKVCVTATEKGKSLLLAPYVVYRGHGGAQDVDGVVIERDGKAPNKEKIDAFKVSDLSEIALTDRSFAPVAGFDPADAKYADKIVCIVNLV